MKSGIGTALGLAIGCGLAAAACTRVVETRTTSEIRPMRYAIVEFTQQHGPADSAIAHAKRALAAENLKLIREDRATGTVEGGPAHFAAEGDQPALAATVAVTAKTEGTATKFRVYASAVLPVGAVGGVDPRLSALVQRVSARIR